MNTRNNLTRGRAALWSRDKIELLSTPEVRNLHANAERLLEIAALCLEVLGARPRSGVAAPAKPAPRVRRAKAKAEEAA